jgi:PAS domain S-box-containing protein
VIGFRNKLSNVVGWLGLAIGLTVAATVPAGYLLVAYSQVDHQLSLLADMKASRLAKYIYLHQKLWQYQTLRLAELTEIPEAREVGGQQRIFDSTGKLVLETGEAPAFPIARRSSPIVVAGLQVATVETAATFRPILLATAIAAALSSLLGLAVVFIIRILPQRIIDRTLAKLEAIQTRLTATIEAVPVEFMEYDRQGRLILINSAARVSQGWDGNSIGKTQRELLERTLSRRRVEEPDHDWDGWMAKRLSTLERSGMFELTRPTGESGRFYVTDTPDGGKVVVRVDISELKQREASLAAEMERLTSIFRSSGAGILLLDRDTRVVMANQFILDIQGKSSADVIGHRYSELAITGLDSTVIERWQAASNTAPLTAVEFDYSLGSSRDARRIIKVTATPVQDGTGALRYIVLIGVDDTERRMGEIKLFDSARLANLGEMATGMAHEINQPLATIRMASETLIEELDLETSGMAAELTTFFREKLIRIATQTDRASGLVRDLRAVARRPANESRPFDVVEVARVCDGLLHEQLRVARVALSLDLPPASVLAQGESSRLQQVLINLVLNARDALTSDPDRPSTGMLGHIAVRVAVAPEGGTVLTVEDDGPGIPPAVFPRLFEPFFTTKPTGKGTGLGLSISHGIVKHMGGEIDAQNRSGGGARFRIILPALTQLSPQAGLAA